jgi:hypothetical protein
MHSPSLSVSTVAVTANGDEEVFNTRVTKLHEIEGAMSRKARRLLDSARFESLSVRSLIMLCREHGSDCKKI